MKWFRFYSETLHKPKARRLPPTLFKDWVMILCLANMGEPRGRLPSVADIGDHLGRNAKSMERTLAALKERGLLDKERGHLVPHDWDKWQPVSDNAPERMRNFRRTQPEDVQNK